MAKRIAPEEVEHFISLYQAGKNTPEISELTGRSLRAVCYSLKEAGIELRAEQPTKAGPEVEQQVLRLYRDGKLRTEVAEATGISEASVTNILRRLGVEPDWFDAERRAKWAALAGDPSRQPNWAGAETEDLILRLYCDGTDWESIAAEAKVSIKTVANVLARRGVAVSRWFKANAGQRLQILELLAAGADIATISSTVGLTEDAVKRFTAYGRASVFSEIDTPEKAYWLGFLNADGSILGVNPGTLRLQVALARKDREHLVKLRAFFGIDREIWDYEARTIGGVLRPYSRLICQERPVVIDLARLGILPNKTGKEKPWEGPDHLMPHYWRGMVDGDGSVPGKAFSVTLVGSYDVVAAFTLWAGAACGSQVNPSRDKRSPDHWRACIGGGRQVPVLVRALYKDAPVALDRKMALAEPLF